MPPTLYPLSLHDALPIFPDLFWRSWTAGHLNMPGIIEFPKLIQDALAQYGDLFANECQRRHLAEYLTGLIVADRKSTRLNSSHLVISYAVFCLEKKTTLE